MVTSKEPTQIQIEQDLVLSRLVVEIAGHELLGGELALRGGTRLNKLHLPQPLRYSEDLDYVRRTRSGIKPYLTALREVALDAGLVEHGTTQSGQMVHIVFDAEATGGPGRIRVKIETNIAEIDSFLPRITLPYAVDSPLHAAVVPKVREIGRRLNATVRDTDVRPLRRQVELSRA